MDEVRRRLLAKSFLYDDPASYAAGVEAALAAARDADRLGNGTPGHVAATPITVLPRQARRRRDRPAG